MYTRPFEDELYHYGIKGMKWGIRRFQDKNGHLTASGKKRYDENESDQKSGGIHLTDKQKTAIKIGATIAAAALVTYGAYKLGAFDKFKRSGESAAKKIIEETDAPKKTAKSVSDILKNVNPTGSNTNCRACSIATSLKLRGIDAEALDIPSGSLSDAVKSCFKNARVSEMYDPTKERVNSYILKKFGEGSQGAMSAEFNLPTGKFQHAFNWVVKDGTVQFMDGQQGLSDFSKYLEYLSPDKSVEIARLDNLEIDPENIGRFIKRR